jgi:ABC-type transport system involved in cytochrome c biogenesis permease component
MTFLPIVARELRVASRRRVTYWSRSVTAVGTIIIGLFVFANNGNEAPHIVGQNLFGVISWLAFVYCFGVGVSTADCLSEEKREGTLGLLFLTDLKGYDVIVGKLVATSLNAFYALLSIFPVLAIPCSWAASPTASSGA